MIGFWLWLLLLPLDLLMTIAGYLLAPLLVLFASDAGWLPARLSWFQTPDNSLDGDPDFFAAHAAMSRYRRRVLWMWRNPVYGFAYSVTAATPPAGTPLQLWGNPAIRDVPTFRPGWLFIRQAKWWHFYLVLPSLGGKCLRVNLGWKLTADGDNNPAMYVFYANPCKARGVDIPQEETTA